MGPSTLRCEFPWEVVVVYVGFLFFALSGFLSVLCDAVVISQGSAFCSCSFEPFTTRPVFGVCLRPSSFCLVSFVGDCFSLSLSLSGAGETQTFLVWGSPCVSSSWPRSRHRPVHPPLHLHQGPAPAPVFFFSSRRSRWVVVGVWSRGGVSVRVLFSVVFWFWFGRCCSLVFLHLLLHRKTALPGIRPQRRLPPFPPPIGLSGVTRLLLGVVPWTGRSVAGWECRRLCDPATSRVLTTIIIIVRPGHRRPPPNRPRPLRQAGVCWGFLFFVCNAT